MITCKVFKCIRTGKWIIETEDCIFNKYCYYCSCCYSSYCSSSSSSSSSCCCRCKGGWSTRNELRSVNDGQSLTSQPHLCVVWSYSEMLSSTNSALSDLAKHRLVDSSRLQVIITITVKTTAATTTTSDLVINRSLVRLPVVHCRDSTSLCYRLCAGLNISVCYRSPRSTQPSIPPGQVNRIPASGWG